MFLGREVQGEFLYFGLNPNDPSSYRYVTLRCVDGALWASTSHEDDDNNNDPEVVLFLI